MNKARLASGVAARCKRGVFALVHGAYLCLPAGARRLIVRYRPLALREFVRGHMMPVINAPSGEVYTEFRRLERAPGSAQLRPGLTVVGFFAYSFGLGESGRALIRACAAASINFETVSIEAPFRRLHDEPAPHPRPPGAAPRQAALICMNANGMHLVPPELLQAARAGQYHIGHWYWELERFPAQWLDAFHAVDELWAASPFIRDCLARVSPRPVLFVPPPVEVRLQRAYARADFGLPVDKFLFLFSYDFDSYVQRKNPRASIAAFLQAFAPGNDEVMLAIKTLHGDRYPQQLAELREIARADPRVRLLELSLSRDESFGLISVCDSYLSLHRSEGFGLGMAEAMALGKPVVATGYSGNLAFMQPDNSCLVGYRLVPVGADEYLHGEGQVWAEPDIADAARQMRRLVQDMAFRIDIGARAARHMAEHFSAYAVGLRIRERLEAIAAWRARSP